MSLVINGIEKKKYSHKAVVKSPGYNERVSCPEGTFVIGIEVVDTDSGEGCSTCISGIKLRCSGL